MASMLRETHRVLAAPSGARYAVLDIDVPAGAIELAVEYRCDEPGARIDIGIADERGSAAGLPGFRGWSGSARTGFVIGPEAATPGFLAGPINAGRWSVLVGLYVVPSLCTIEVDVEIFDSSATTRGLTTRISSTSSHVADRRVVAGWVSGDLHTHTEHSGDAAKPIPVADLVGAADAAGFAFLAVTDHNTTAHHRELATLQPSTAVNLIRALEVTSYAGHMNAFGVDEIVDFRITDTEGLARALASIDEQGGLASICHPKSVGPPWELPVADGVTAIEAWGAPWLWGNGESLYFWDRQLRQGRRLTAVGGSDIHDFSARPGHALGTPTTWVPDGAEPLAAIRSGQVVISDRPDGALIVPERERARRQVRVVGGDGGRLRAVGETGPFFSVDVNSDDADVDVPASESAYVRFELWGPGPFRSGPVGGRLGTMWSMTSAVWGEVLGEV